MDEKVSQAEVSMSTESLPTTTQTTQQVKNEPVPALTTSSASSSGKLIWRMNEGYFLFGCHILK